MKQTTKMWIGMTILAFASSAVTGAVVKKTTTNEAPTPILLHLLWQQLRQAVW